MASAILPPSPAHLGRGRAGIHSGSALADRNQGEEALIARAQQDPECFGQLYDHYLPMIYRYVASRVRTQELAEDVTSEVFFKALRAIGRYRHTGRPFSAWLYRIAINAITDHYRSRRSAEDSLDGMPELVDASPAVEDEVAHRLGAQDIWSLIESLPKQQRIAMTLKYGEDMKLAQIGDVMGKTEGAVKLLIFRGTASMRRLLQAQPEQTSEGSRRG